MPIARQSDFTNVRKENSNSPQITFYKLLMSTANMHSTVQSFYNMYGQNALANFHKDLSTKFVTEANRVKNLSINDTAPNNE